jgi:hypothetical protein
MYGLDSPLFLFFCDVACVYFPGFRTFWPIWKHPADSPVRPPSCSLLHPYSISIFCSGNTPETKGTAFVIYDDIYDAKNACEHLSGYSFCKRFASASTSHCIPFVSVVCRYLVVLYYSQTKQTKKLDQKKQQAELDRLRATYMKKPEDKDVAT